MYVRPRTCKYMQVRSLWIWPAGDSPFQYLLRNTNSTPNDNDNWHRRAKFCQPPPPFKLLRPSATLGLFLPPLPSSGKMPKANKAQGASKASRLVKSNPFTPVRRLFFKLDRFRPGNRHRASLQEPSPHGNLEPDPVVDTPPEKPAASSTTHTLAHPHASDHKAACMALQNDDLAEDAVIITALSTLPFCCHEDLLTMSRTALVGVAESLNVKLPAVLRISVSRTRTDAAIRNEIEFVVGLRTEMEVPPAPRAQRARLEDGGYVPEVDADEEMDRTPPTSPSARRGRRMWQIYGTPGTPRLERLTEENEDEDEDRPMKRQRTRSSIQDADDSMDVDVGATPTPTPHPTRPCARVLRSHSEHVPSSPTLTPRPRVLRSHSTKLPAEMADVKVDTAFINTKRPKYRKREHVEIGGRRRVSLPAMIRRTSNPKQKARAASTAAACRPFLALPEESTSMSSLTSQSSVEASPASSDSYRVGMKRRRNSIEAEKGIAVGIIGMDMRSNAGRGAWDMDMMD
ncbi:hypothetical protein B0H17DRAFT_147400 [Mycena rosella]|uniref:Uncharacterized protein n=1 Tax=Mycena rosella TaxID=1033263 RepID=A0AAD7GN67_MYCRO|nr:hypothetical protein B0H17DRAFT_147400 [Mycena rosella]